MPLQRRPQVWWPIILLSVLAPSQSVGSSLDGRLGGSFAPPESTGRGVGRMGCQGTEQEPHVSCASRLGGYRLWRVFVPAEGRRLLLGRDCGRTMMLIRLGLRPGGERL